MQKELVHIGKACDTYLLVENNNLILRHSDSVLGMSIKLDTLIPGKGKILNQLSKWWMQGPLASIISNHLIDISIEKCISVDDLSRFKERSVVVKNLEPILIKTVVRRHLTGIAFKEYLKIGMVSGIRLPKGLKDGDRLDIPIFTPMEKSRISNFITFEKMCSQIGTKLAKQIRKISLEIFYIAERKLLKQGIILADTNFKFGLDEFDRLTLKGEVLTPDSSNFWHLYAFYMRGKIVSRDKQKIRDYMLSRKKELGQYPSELPDWLIEEVQVDYIEIFKMITGQNPVI